MTATAPPRSPWIVSARYDALCFVATPLLCAIAVISLSQRVPAQHIWIWVMTFSSFGHHLPGFLRAYGDREIFERHKTQLLFAPPIVFALFLFFGLRELDGMLLVLVLWSIWHVTMQHFGFMRIYDAKSGNTTRTTARLDWAISVGGFATIVLWSSGYTHNLFTAALDAGLGTLPVAAFQALRWVVTGATLLISLAYAVHHGRLAAQGLPFSKIKLALLVITLGFLGGVWIGLGNIILGLAAWELFHDIQYFALTWVYNRRLVETGTLRSRGLALLFRGGAGLAALYVLLCGAYGSVNYGIAVFAEGPIQAWLLAFVFTSTLLHYYYDSFIWKVRQPRVRDGLGIDAQPAQATTPRSAKFTPRFAYTILFVAGCLALAVVESRADATSQSLADRLAIRDAVPDDPNAEANLGLAYDQAGDAEAARTAYQRALALDGTSVSAHVGLGLLDLRDGSIERAGKSFSRAIANNPDPIRSTPSAPTIAIAYLNLGNVRMSAGAAAEALELFDRALRIDPNSGPAHLGRARALGELNRSGEAASERALALQLGETRARLDLARQSWADGDRERALEITTDAVALGEADSALMRLHGLLLAESGNLPQAAEVLAQVLAVQPSDPEAAFALAAIYRAQGRVSEAADQLGPLFAAGTRPPVNGDRAPSDTEPAADLFQQRALLIECLLLSGRAADAVPHLRAAIADSAAGDNFGLRLALAEVLASNPDPAIRDGSQALAIAQGLVEETQGSDPGPLSVLAAAQLELGQPTRALATLDRAIEAARAAKRADVVDQLEQRKASIR